MQTKTTAQIPLQFLHQFNVKFPLGWALKYLPNHFHPKNGVLNHTFSKKKQYFFLLLRTKIHGSREDYNGAKF